MRIVVADDNNEVRSALRLLLLESGEPACVSVVEAADAPTLVRRLSEDPSDVVLLDWELPGLRPAELLAEMRRLAPDCRVIAMSGRPEAHGHSLSLGVDGFVSKNEPPDGLFELLRLTPTSSIDSS
jgi:two-component system response regulator DesR